MYGLISKIIAAPGQREALGDILVAGTRKMPGCLSYIIAVDPSDEDALWVTEVWVTQEKHEASLKLPSVKEAIEQGMPLIANFAERVVTQPLGGLGLAPEQSQ
jgi:quinol monooxygenase YgiN